MCTHVNHRKGTEVSANWKSVFSKRWWVETELRWIPRTNKKTGSKPGTQRGTPSCTY